MAAPVVDPKAVVDIASKGAEKFIDYYYKTFDTQRHLVSKFYRDNSAIVWNGNPFSGAAAFSEFCLKYPATQHKVETFDCHPLMGSLTPSGSCPIVVTVYGTVRLGDKKRRAFSEGFVLQSDAQKEGTYYVRSNCHRFVGPEEDDTEGDRSSGPSSGSSNSNNNRSGGPVR